MTEPVKQNFSNLSPWELAAIEETDEAVYDNTDNDFFADGTLTVHGDLFGNDGDYAEAYGRFVKNIGEIPVKTDALKEFLAKAKEIRAGLEKSHPAGTTASVVATGPTPPNRGNASFELVFEIPLSATVDDNKYASYGPFIKAVAGDYRGMRIYELRVNLHDLVKDKTAFGEFADKMLADMDAEWKSQADFFRLGTADSILKYPDNVDRYNCYRLLQGLKEGKVTLSIALSDAAGNALVEKAREVKAGLFVNSGKKAQITGERKVGEYSLFELNLDLNDITPAEKTFLNNEILQPTRDEWAGTVDYAVPVDGEDDSAGWAETYDELAPVEQKETARIIREQRGIDFKNYYAFVELLSNYIPPLLFSLPADITTGMFPISQADFTTAAAYKQLTGIENSETLFNDGKMTYDTLLAYATDRKDNTELLAKLYDTVKFAAELPEKQVAELKAVAIEMEKGFYDTHEGWEPGDVIEGDQDEYTLTVADDSEGGKNISLTLSPHHFDALWEANPLDEEWTRGDWEIHLYADGRIGRINFISTDGGWDDIFSRVEALDKKDKTESADGTAVNVMETEKLYFAPLVTAPWNGGAAPWNTEKGKVYTSKDAYDELARVLDQIREREGNEGPFLQHVIDNLKRLELEGDREQYAYLNSPSLAMVTVN